jgi:ATP-binding cassette subfamily C protein CydD
MLGQRFHASTTGVSAAKRITEILAVNPDSSDLPSESNLSNRSRKEFDRSPVGVISFKNVECSHGSRLVLRDVSFEVRRGETIALFGPTGSGKSTIFNLLLRFASPTGGDISIDGMPLEQIPAGKWRQQLGWVPQRPHMFHKSILENIRLARPEATLEEVERAAHAAQLGKFISSLPDGYETVVGEHGARLSGGEAQRLALARAFLRDAPILLLDEPTSNVDPETETHLQRATERLMVGRTVIVIAHRLATIYRADRIVVLDGGQVVQSGKHADLLAEDGLYRRLALSTKTGLA